MIDAVIWDIDGTLVDSEPLHLLALQTVSTRHGVDISDLPDDHFVGVNLFGVWDGLRDRYPPGLTMTAWVDELNAIYAAGTRGLVQIPGAVTVIRSLAIHGIRQAAVSNSNRVVVDANLAALGVVGLMDFSLSLDDVTHGKPHPEPYLRALDRLGLTSAQVLAVEDSRTGVRSAKAAGVRVLGLGSPDLAADQSISALSEILDLLHLS